MLWLALSDGDLSKREGSAVCTKEGSVVRSHAVSWREKLLRGGGGGMKTNDLSKYNDRIIGIDHRPEE